VECVLCSISGKLCAKDTVVAAKSNGQFICNFCQGLFSTECMSCVMMADCVEAIPEPYKQYFEEAALLEEAPGVGSSDEVEIFVLLDLLRRMYEIMPNLKPEAFKAWCASSIERTAIYLKIPAIINKKKGELTT